MALGGLAEGLLASQQIIGSQQEQQYRALQMRALLTELAQRQRQQQQQQQYQQWLGSQSGAFGQAAPDFSAWQMPAGYSGPTPQPQTQAAQSQPAPTGGMAGPPQIGPPVSPELAQLQRQVLGLEGNQDYGVGKAGELGPGQIKPATGAEYGFSPSQLVGNSGRQASATIVGDLYRQSGGDAAATLVGYNAGPGAMRKFQASGDRPDSVKLAPAYQNAVAADLSPEQRDQASQTAITAAGMLPPTMVGRAPPGIFAQLVARIGGSDMDDDTKGYALMQLLPLMSQEGQRAFAQQWEMTKFGVEQGEKRAEFGQREQELEAGRAQTRELAEERMQTSRDLLSQRQEANPGAVALQKFVEEHPNATAEQIQSFVQQGRSARSGPAMAAQAYLREHPNATADEIRNFVAQTAAQTAATRQFDVGVQGNTVRSLNVAIQHLGTLQDAANALQNGDTRAFNRLGNTISAELGFPAPTDFNATKGIVKDEVVKAILGGVGALGDRQEVEATIDAANSPEQLAGVIRRYEQLMGGQMSGLGRQFVTSGAGTEEDFEKKLLPRTIDALKRAKEGEGQGGGGGPYKVGDIINKGGRRWRVTGGDPSDPDVEPAQ